MPALENPGWKHPAWPHQSKEYAIGRDKENRYLIWPMRSGKSKAVIDKACYQYRHGGVQAAVIIAPNGVHLNWVDKEIPTHAWDECKSMIFAWETPKRNDPEYIRRWQEFLQYRGMRWFAINMEALKELDNRRALREFIATLDRNRKGKRKFLMAISEAHHFGRPGSKRTYFARSLGLIAAFKMLESGTPVLNSPLKAFSQIDILKAGALGFDTFTNFRRHFAVYKIEHNQRTGRAFPKLDHYQNLGELTSKLAEFCSVVLRDELKGMPPLIRTERPVVMSETQRQAYLEMVSHHLIEIGDRDIDAVEASERVQKLQQITHGWIKKEDKIYDIDVEAPFYDAVLEQVDGTLPGKTLIWCRYKETCRRLVKLLQRSYGVVQYHGDISMDQRRKNRLAFLNDPDVGVCVGTPNAGGEGLDFSSADAVIFAGSVPNALLVKQGEERGTVLGGKSVAVVRVTTPGTIDDRNWEIVDTNSTISESLVGPSLRDWLLRTTC